jgi:hypothetical protein
MKNTITFLLLVLLLGSFPIHTVHAEGEPGVYTGDDYDNDQSQPDWEVNVPIIIISLPGDVDSTSITPQEMIQNIIKMSADGFETGSGGSIPDYVGQICDVRPDLCEFGDGHMDIWDGGGDSGDA